MSKQVDLMRLADYSVGSMLCLLFSGLNSILRLIFQGKDIVCPKKILFVKFSEIGSIVLAYPLLNRVKLEYPDAQIFFVTFKTSQPILEALGLESRGKLMCINEKSMRSFIMDTVVIVKSLRRERIDACFGLEIFSSFAAAFIYACSIPKRISFFPYNLRGIYLGNLLTHRVHYNPLIHISRAYLSLLQTMKLDYKFTPDLSEDVDIHRNILPRFVLSKTLKKNIWHKLCCHGVKNGSRLYLLNVGDGILPLREWPVRNFAILARKFLEDAENHIVLIGSEGGLMKSTLLCDYLKSERCVNLVAKTSLEEILSLFSIAQALIVNDSGLAHIASLTEVKKFILFGPESPLVYRPFGKRTWIIYGNLPCSPCFSAFNFRKSSCNDNRCLKEIPPDMVYNLIMKH